jgi:hypothetical protein
MTGEVDQRGGEWEPIKIPRWNLAYILKSARRPSLLTRSRPYSYIKAIGIRNWVRDRSGTLNDASKTMSEIDDKIRIEEQFISSQAFHRITYGRVRETAV